MVTFVGLQLFNEKADKLESLSFTKQIFSERSGVKASYRQGEPLRVERYGPKDEALDAFVLTLRFFIQNNESSSFANLAQVYDQLPPNLEEVEAFRAARAELNELLDETTMVWIEDRGLTRREIYEVFLWGGLAHANPEKKRKYDEWSKIPFFFELVQNEFVLTLAQVLGVIFRVRELNKSVIAKHQSPRSEGVKRHAG
jgi:uncharacterized protein YjiS (DUF1127 family)